MRITADMVSANALHGVEDAFAALNRSAEELSSGRSIEKPSDEPFGAGRAIALQSTLEGISTYSSNVKEAIGWSTTASGALGSIGNVIQKVRELALQAGNGVDNKQQLAALGEQVEELTESVKQDADVQYAGQYILSGTNTQTAPYASGPEDAYKGNEGSISRAIGPSLSVSIGSPAVTLLGDGAEAKDGKLLDTLRGIASDLKEGTPEALQAMRTTGLGGLESSLQTLVSMQARVGSTIARLQAAEGGLEALQVTTTELLSNTESVNIAKTSIEYSSQQAAYEAALRSGSSIVQLSLLEFLK